MAIKTDYGQPSETPPEMVETIRIKGNRLNIKFVSVSGKEGDYFVMVAPSIMVSGYGMTEEDAQSSFDENIEVFCEDIMAMTQEEREIEFRRLGFAKVPYHNKDYSKAYVDENGVLQGIEPESLKTRLVEKAI